VLKKWNEKKFKNIGFYWKLGELEKSLQDSQNSYIDYVELKFRPGMSKVKIEKLPKIKKRKYPF
jgi:hypothetical protein